jgi:hypothetical protein
MVCGETNRPVLGAGVLLPGAALPDSNIETMHVRHTDPVDQVAGRELRLVWLSTSDRHLPLRSRNRTTPFSPTRASQ